ncbi:uncharacterized protein LOC144147059 isoform X2 [Haemaphysalis longicornis]
MDEECLARGIYTFEEGDAVVIASTAAYYKFFQNVQGDQGSYKVRQRAQSSAPDAADADATDIVPLPSPWPSDPIYRSIGKVLQVRPTGHVDVIFECGREGTGNLQEPAGMPRSRAWILHRIENTTYTVVPEAIVKVPKLLEGDLVKFVSDIRADRSMETTNDFCKFGAKFCVGFVVKDSDGNADNISVAQHDDFYGCTRLKLDLIARPAVGDFRATLTDCLTSGKLGGMQDFMQELPDVNMKPTRMASSYAPGNVVAVSKDFTMAIRRHVEQPSSCVSEMVSFDISPNERHEIARQASSYAPGNVVAVSKDFTMAVRRHVEQPSSCVSEMVSFDISPNERHEIARQTAWKRIKSLKHSGTVLQVISSGYVVVLFADDTVWHIQSSFLKLVQSSKGRSNGEGTLFPKILSKQVDILIPHLLRHDNMEVRKGCLRAACCLDKEALLSVMITMDESVECEDANGNKLLHYAARSKQPEMITHLMSLGANINATNNRSHTALQVAAKAGFLDCVRDLTKYKKILNPNIQDDIGNTALHVAIANTNVGIFDELLQLPNVDFTLTNKYGLNALHMAALKGDATMTEKLLSRMNGLVDVKQQDHGYGALHFAAVNGHCHVVETLLTQESCTVDLPNKTQTTALLLAAQQGYWGVAELLILAGANVHLADRQGNTALHLSLMALNEHSGEHQDIPTHPAMKAVEKKILEHGHTNFDTRLRMACFLLRCGADICCRNREGITPLNIAYCLGQPSLEVLVFVRSCTWIPESGKCDGCLEAPAQISFTPCGHCLYCNDCAQPMKRCFSCGTVIVARADTGCSSDTVPQNKKSEVSKAKIPVFAEEVYRMENNPRGMCIIINNVNFHDHQKPRDGSDIDADKMKSLFTNLYFEVTVNTNLTAQDMLNVLSNAAKAEQQRTADCLIVILMSHGSNDTIEGTDSKCLRLRNQVYGLFNNANCPALKGKPKLFFVQACRGEKRNFATDNSQPFPTADNAPPGPVPEWSDMYCAYATIPEYVALRDPERGSWFFSAVYDVFSLHAATTDLEGLMKKVTSQVMQHCTPDNTMQTTNTETYGWRKQLYFNPGNARIENAKCIPSSPKRIRRDIIQ